MNRSLFSLNEAELVLSQYHQKDNFHYCQKSKIALILDGDCTIKRIDQTIDVQKGDIFYFFNWRFIH